MHPQPTPAHPRRILVAALAATILLAVVPCGARAVTFTGPAALVARADRWQQQSRMPLGDETITLAPTVALCMVGHPAGCSYPGTTYARTRWAFLYELGHQFDWAYLTPADRLWLAAKWGVPNVAWPDSTGGLDAGYEDGLEGVFPYWFALCAEGVRTRYLRVRAFREGPAAWSGRFDVCSYIRYLEAHS